MKKAALSLLCVLLLLTACSGNSVNSSAPAQDAGIQYRPTVVYYADSNGLLVPVVREIPWEEGIGKAALNLLAKTDTNVSAAASLGLSPTLPKDASFSLRIADDGTATVSVFGMGEFQTAAEEKNAVVSIVNTLTEFASIDRVVILPEGEKKEALSFGTKIDEAIAAVALNPESVTASAGGSTESLTLYFPNYESTLNVPVTRFIEGEATLEKAVEELVKGPGQIDALRSCFPPDTELRSVIVEGGVAIIDLSAIAEGLREHPLLEQRAMECAALVCREFGVPTVSFRIEGKDYGDMPVSAPMYVNHR
jgi:germination protein M